LSHRWGSRGLLKTASKTLSNHIERIPWDQLPLTFQDAINIAIALQIKYLWIDSLCILRVNSILAELVEQGTN
jgi:hypothetical protein